MTPEGTPNSYLLDPESQAELARLINLDQLTTRAMGGPLAGIDDPLTLHDILDLGCGPSGWVLDVAFALPQSEVAGIDISKGMIDYAIARARSQQRSNASFDLVNARFLFAALPTARWAPFLAECTRILRPGGILRLTELHDLGDTTSLAFQQMQQLLFQMMHQQHYGFSPDGSNLGFTTALPHLLWQTGYRQVQAIAHTLDVSAGTEAWSAFYRTMEECVHLACPALSRQATSARRRASASIPSGSSRCRHKHSLERGTSPRSAVTNRQCQEGRVIKSLRNSSIYMVSQSWPTPSRGPERIDTHLTQPTSVNS